MTLSLLSRLEKPLPRYTSYPTAPMWTSLGSEPYLERLSACSSPLSLYFHLPFCEKICFFCGCSTLLNRKKENETRYIEALIKEIDLVTQAIGTQKKVLQLHMGGGTPSKLDNALFSLLFEKLTNAFLIDQQAEIAIEVDPRNLAQESDKLLFFRSLGFNRLSFGVQDVDPKVQEAIGRRQSLAMTQNAMKRAREAHFSEINLDLIYGLPFQSAKGFEKTVKEVLLLQPERIALYSFAYLPHLKPHQRAISPESLPSSEEKFKIYAMAREAFITAGYITIGMDHFARKGSELAKSYLEKTLHRNFQGYGVKKADRLLGLGITAISDMGDSFFQNEKTLVSYYEAINQGKIPTALGLILSLDDRIRSFVISSLMCHFEIDKKVFKEKFLVDFDAFFSREKESIDALAQEGLLHNHIDLLAATPLGELFIRNIASVFDSYLQKEKTRATFSLSI